MESTMTTMAPTLPLDVERIRADFPILGREVNGRRLVYLDSGNTSQKPRQVIDAVREHFERHNANVARSVHTLGTEATAAYEGARVKVSEFINANSWTAASWRSSGAIQFVCCLASRIAFSR